MWKSQQTNSLGLGKSEVKLVESAGSFALENCVKINKWNTMIKEQGKVNISAVLASLQHLIWI
jgi:hypothetical protein